MWMKKGSSSQLTNKGRVVVIRNTKLRGQCPKDCDKLNKLTEKIT